MTNNIVEEGIQIICFPVSVTHACDEGPKYRLAAGVGVVKKEPKVMAPILI